VDFFDGRLSGAYYEGLAQSAVEDEGGDDEDAPALLRLRAGATTGWDAVSVEAAYEVNGTWSKRLSEEEALGRTRTTKLRIDDLDPELSRRGERLFTQNLDRLNAQTFLPGGAVLTVGRQAIGHGSGRFFNPTDIFAPVAPQTTYSEYKQGVDALRFEVPLGETFSWELWTVAHEAGASESYYLARARALLPDLSLSAYAGSTLGEATAALDLSGALFEAEWHVEGVMRFDEPPSRSLRAAGGIHHRLPWQINLLAEIQFNGVGRSDPDEYYLVTRSRAWRNGEISLTGRWHTCLGLDFEPVALLSVGATWLQNTDDGSALVQPGLSWSMSDRLTLRAGASKGYGKRPERLPTPVGTVTLPKSEFGSYGEMIYGEVSFDL